MSRPDFTGLLLAIPSYGGVKPATMLSLWNTALFLSRIGCPVDMCMQSGNALIADTRNQLLAGFMKTDYSHCLFIDADLEWEPGTIPKMLARMEKADVDVVCGTYRKKYLDVERVAYAINFDPKTLEMPEQDEGTGLVKVHGAPGGWLLLTRKVGHRLIATFPDLKIEKDPGTPLGAEEFYFDFFGQITKDGKKLGEDFSFSERLKEAGLDIWLDPYCKLNHWGEYCWKGDVTEMFEMEAQPQSAA